MACFKFSSSVNNVKDFEKKTTSTVGVGDVSLETNVVDGSKLSSETDITQETLTELEDVCR